MTNSTIWIDGAPFAKTEVQVRLHEELGDTHRLFYRCDVGRRVFHSVIGWREASFCPLSERFLQVWIDEVGRGFVGLGGQSGGDGIPWLGPVFEVDPVGIERPSVAEGWSFTEPVVVVVDDLRMDVPICAARVRQLVEPTPACESWVSVLVELELAPGPLPNRALAWLTQPRTARRLSIGTPGSEGVTLTEVGCVRAVALGEPEQPLAVDAPLTLQLLLSARAPRPSRANELEPLPAIEAADFANIHGRLEALEEYCGAMEHDAYRVVTTEQVPTTAQQIQATVQRLRKLDRFRAGGRPVDVAFAEIVDDPAALVEQLRAALGQKKIEIRVYDPAILARRSDPDMPLVWLRRAIAHAQPQLTPLERQLVERLDRHGAAPIDADEWTVLADLLLSRGDPLAQALLAGEPPSSGPERALWEATRDPESRWRIEGREWAPRVRGTWFGPFLTTLVVEPGWIRLAGLPHEEHDGPTQRWPDEVDFHAGVLRFVNPGPERIDALFAEDARAPVAPKGPAIGELLELQRWGRVPGFDARPELLDMLRLPCCRLLSSRRVFLAGIEPPSFEYIGAMLEGVDLSGLRIDGPLLQRARLRGANLRGLYVYCGSVAGADLREADLRGATLDRVELVDADLRGADLRGIRLEHLGAKRLAGAKLRDAKIDVGSIESWRELGCDLSEFDIC